MLIQIHTDRNVQGRETMVAEFSEVVASARSRFSHQITQVEVHLSDENSNKKGGSDDMRCMMEARLQGRQPIAVTHQAATLDQAVAGADRSADNSADDGARRTASGCARRLRRSDALRVYL